MRFGYVPSQPVLRGLSLRVTPGETLALVGPAGSGKSTISLLLPRFYDVSGGALRVGGHDVRDLTQDSLRSAIGLVMEDSFLFSDTVAGNIAFGRPDATREQIVAAARAAEADGFIAALPQGYDTVVGEQGLTLSGGQRQRVALARALLTDPRDPGPRRRHVRGRPAGGGRDPRDAPAGHARPHHAAHRPPALHPAAGAADRGTGPGAPGRRGQPRGADGPLPAVPAAAGRARRGRGGGRRGRTGLLRQRRRQRERRCQRERPRRRGRPTAA